MNRRDEGELEEGEAYSSKESEYESMQIDGDQQDADPGVKFPLYLELTLSKLSVEQIQHLISKTNPDKFQKLAQDIHSNMAPSFIMRVFLVPQNDILTVSV